MEQKTASKVYSIWSILKWIAIACLMLYLARDRRDKIYESQNGFSRCQRCYEDAQNDVTQKGSLVSARYYEFGPCSAAFTESRFPVTDELGPRLLQEHSWFAMSSWRGAVSESKWLLYQGAGFFVALVLVSIFYMVVPFVDSDWTPNMISLFVLIGSLLATLTLMFLPSLYRLTPIPTVVDAGVSGDKCYVAVLTPMVVTLNLAASVSIPFLLIVSYLIARFAYSGDRKGPEMSTVINAVIVCLYAAFVLWMIVSNLSQTKDYIVLVIACLAAFTPFETMLMVFIHSPEMDEYRSLNQGRL